MRQDHAEPGPVIAIIGCDGSGKSTVSAAVFTHAQHFGPARLVHLGKQAGNIGRAIARWPLVGKSLGKIIVRKTKSARKMREKKTPDPLSALVIMAFALRRWRRFSRMRALRQKGLIIITDRYPQSDVAGGYDGPELSARAKGNTFVRWLARREERIYLGMTRHKPDLVLRLNVDLETALARKPDHRRDLLAEKITATPLFRFNGAPIVEIDANQPLDDVLDAARNAVATTLANRGYKRPDTGA